jgi:hypothetical protein
MTKARYDWYLNEWLAYYGKRQRDIVADLDWNKARVSLMVRGTQPYTRDAVNELASYLNIKPFELLMHPEEAMAIRRLRETAAKIAEDQPVADLGRAMLRKTGTAG